MRERTDHVSHVRIGAYLHLLIIDHDCPYPNRI
jgi:hypothetical protein